MTGTVPAGTVLLDLTVMLLAARAGGAALARAGQPQVIGELCAGVILGPTVLGALPGDPSHALFSAQARPVVSAVGQLGLVLFMFTVGWDLDLALLRRRARATAFVSLGSVVPPIALGLLLALQLHPHHRVVDGRLIAFWPFALFVAASLSMTALPVLARIVRETGLAGSAVGTLALSAAAMDDVLGWSTVALALAALGSSGAWGYLATLAEAIALAAGVLLLARPLLRAGLHGGSSATQALVVPLALGCAALSDAIGMHAVLGALLAGLAMPRAGATAGLVELRRRLSPAVALLAPIYFVGSGMSVDLPGLHAGDAGDLVLILAAGCAGKFLGAFGGARAAGIQRRDAAAVGVLMNTRGLVEIVLLTVGRDAGLIDGRLFTLLAVMALVTTMLTPPLLRALARAGPVSGRARVVPSPPKAA